MSEMARRCTMCDADCDSKHATNDTGRVDSANKTTSTWYYREGIVYLFAQLNEAMSGPLSVCCSSMAS